jgi:hypothetical protein
MTGQGRAGALTDSREKNAASALFLLKLAEARGDQPRMTLAQAMLRECGYPCDANTPPLDEAIAAVSDQGGTRC